MSRLDPWVGKITWRRNWQATPVFLPGKSHGQRSLEGCSREVAELDTTEQLTPTYIFTNIHICARDIVIFNVGEKKGEYI